MIEKNKLSEIIPCWKCSNMNDCKILNDLEHSIFNFDNITLLSITLLDFKCTLFNKINKPIRKECTKCNHNPVCKWDLKSNLEGNCPFYEGE